MNQVPEHVEIVGDFLALRRPDGHEMIVSAKTLRANSPSAEQTGESDLFGNVIGRSSRSEFNEVELVKFEQVGNYALRLHFSDGHSSGIYSWEHLEFLARS